MLMIRVAFGFAAMGTVPWAELSIAELPRTEAQFQTDSLWDAKQDSIDEQERWDVITEV